MDQEIDDDTSSSTSIDQEKVSRRSSESSMSKMTDDNSFEVNIIEEVDLENETGGSKSHHAQSNNNDSVSKKGSESRSSCLNCKELVKLFNASSVEIKKLQKQLLDTINKHNDLRKEYFTLQSKIKQPEELLAEKEWLKKECQSQKDTLNRQTANLEELKTNIIELTAENLKLQDMLKKNIRIEPGIRVEKDSFENDFDKERLKQEVAKLKKEIVDLKSNHQTTNNSERETNQKVIRNLHKDLATCRKELNDTKEYCSKLSVMKELLEEEKKTCNTTLNDYKIQVKTYHDDVVSKFNEKNRELAKALKELKELKGKFDTVVCANANYIARESRLQKDLETKTREYNELKKNYELFSNNLHVIEEDEITSWEVSAPKVSETLPSAVIKIEETEQRENSSREDSSIDSQRADNSESNKQTSVFVRNISELFNSHCDIDYILQRVQTYNQTLKDTVQHDAQRNSEKKSKKRKLNTL